MRDTAYKAMQIKEKLINENQKEPTVEEIAKELGLKKEVLKFSLKFKIKYCNIKRQTRNWVCLFILQFVYLFMIFYSF